MLCLWQHAELAATYSGMASAFDRQGDDEQALEHWRKAVAIEIKALGPEDLGVARTYSKMAVACEQQGEDEEALEVRTPAARWRSFSPGCAAYTAVPRCQHHSKALAIKLKALGPYHPEVDQTHDSMANAFDRMTPGGEPDRL